MFMVIYALLVCYLPSMERDILLDSIFYIRSYASLQNMREIRINSVKAACLACIWPFAVHAGPRMFVELGGFSMACFAIASRVDKKQVQRTTSKLFWNDLFRRVSIPTPRLIAWCDARERVHMVNRSIQNGVRKPDRGMYGLAVRRETLSAFLRSPKANDILQEEIQSSDGVAGKSFRICTFRGARGVRVLAVFIMSLSNATIAPVVWNELIEFAKRFLVQVHSLHFSTLPLIGWDVMHTHNGVVALEGNPGGSLGMHLIPFMCQIGAVDASIAATWLRDLREAYSLGIYDATPPRI